MSGAMASAEEPWHSVDRVESGRSEKHLKPVLDLDLGTRS